MSEPDRRKMRGMLVVEMNYLRRASLDKMRVRIATGGLIPAISVWTANQWGHVHLRGATKERTRRSEH